MSDNQEHLRKLRSTLIRRLEILEVQKATYGITAPPHITIEIEDIQEQLKTIAGQLPQPEPGSRIEEPSRIDPPVKMKLSDEEKERIIELLIDQAATAMVGPITYLRDLIARAKLPARLQTQASSGLSGDATIDARRLIEWAIAKGPHPDRPETTVLVCLLSALRQDVSDTVLDQIITR